MFAPAFGPSTQNCFSLSGGAIVLSPHPENKSFPPKENSQEQAERSETTDVPPDRSEGASGGHAGWLFAWRGLCVPEE
jgi:hypothetical protein